MLPLHPRNPLVTLVRQADPSLNDEKALLAALETRAAFRAAIDELGSLARNALRILGDGSNNVLVYNAVLAFLGGLNAGLSGPQMAACGNRRAVFLVAAYPSLRERINSATDPDMFDSETLRRLFADCEAMLTGGPAAE